jgi:hypothetical protein
VADYKILCDIYLDGRSKNIKRLYQLFRYHVSESFLSHYYSFSLKGSKSVYLGTLRYSLRWRIGLKSVRGSPPAWGLGGGLQPNLTVRNLYVTKRQSEMYDLKISRRLNSIKSSRAISRIRRLYETDDDED